MARIDWNIINGTTNNNNAFFTGIRWRYRDDLFGTTGYPTDRISSNTDIIEYQPYVGKNSSNYTSNYYNSWLTSNYKYSYNTTSGEDPGTASNQENIQTTFRFDKASVNTNYYLTKGSLTSGNVMNTNSNTTSRIIQVPHCNDGTSKLRLYFYFAGYSGTSFTSATTNEIVTLETIPRASQIGVPDANIGSSTNIAINKASDIFTTSLFYKATGQSEWTQIISKTNLQVYAWTVPTSFYALIPNSKTIQCEFKAETYSEDTLIGTTATTATFTATGDPIINSITKTDINEITTALTGNNSKMVKYISNVRINVSATAQNSATIDSITVNGITAVNGVVNFNSATANLFEIVIIDSRGNSTTQTETMIMVDYIPLTINATIERHTPVDGDVNIAYNGNYFNDTFGDENNTLTVQYRSIEKGGSWENVQWNNLTPTISGNTYSGNPQLSGYDYTKQYEFQIRAIDETQTKVIEGINLPKGKPIFNWEEDMFNVNGSIYQNEVLLSNIYLALAGGTISGNLDVSGDLKKNGNNVALDSDIPTNVSELNNDSDFVSLDGVLNEYSNTNGDYVKFESGLQICYLYKEFNTTSSTSSLTTSGNVYYANTQWDFPAPFKTGTTPIVVASALDKSTGVFGSCVEVPSEAYATITIYGPASNRASGIAAIAIGKWK